MTNKLYAILKSEVTPGDTVRTSLETVLECLKNEYESEGYAHPIADKEDLMLMYALDRFLNGN